MRSPLFIFLVSLFLIMSCTATDDKVSESPSPTPEKNSENLSIMQLDMRLAAADSLVFVFYKDPQGKDSLRYTRYYKQYASIDSGLIRLVRTNLMDPTNRFEKIKKCRSEGKIWCFTKGEIFQTIYFSSFSTECSFMYIIKDGQFYYGPISKEMSVTLRELQKKSLEPSVKAD